MTIETDRDKLRVVSLTKFNHNFVWLLLGASGGSKASLNKATHVGKTKGCLFRWPFFHALILSSFLHHPSANFAIAKRFARSIPLRQLVT